MIVNFIVFRLILHGRKRIENNSIKFICIAQYNIKCLTVFHTAVIAQLELSRKTRQNSSKRTGKVRDKTNSMIFVLPGVKHILSLC